ncbi:hypothetical protein Tcan_16515 [Toxocara canis]|uniref:Uncharacterized protein n=1 Tax=Toxocara canis TaxID=6265 RepID=A0A0B2VM94_TOXCA|nr:hypothetical protein Tcan_16515 [Toxocara canis]
MRTGRFARFVWHDYRHNDSLTIAVDVGTKRLAVSVADDLLIFELASQKMTAKLPFLSKQEIEQVSGHSAEIGFSGTSTCLAIGHRGHLIGSSTGHVIHLPFEVLDNITVLHTHVSSAITVTSSTAQCLLLYVGFEDGHVTYFRFNGPSDIQHEEELVLCSLDDLSNLKVLVKELDVERNFIRRETESVVRECTLSKEAEVKAMREQLQQNSATMNEKVKRIEEELENAQIISGMAVENLRKLYDDEALSQKNRFEKALNDQIRNSLNNEQHLRSRIENAERELHVQRNRLIRAFNFTEDSLLAVIEKQQQHIAQMKNALELEKGAQNEVIVKHEREIKNIKDEQEFRNLNHKKELIELETELRLLKTTCIILTEERDEARNVRSETQLKLERSEQLAAALREQLDREQQTVKEERKKMKRLEEKEAISREKIVQLTHHLAAVQKEVKTEKTQQKISQKKLQEIYAKIDELSKDVYNSRNLEHNVLALIAYLKKQ